MPTKWLFASKTFWLNLISGGLQLVQLWSGQHPIDPTILAIVTGVLNLLLRWLATSQPVSINKSLTS